MGTEENTEEPLPDLENNEQAEQNQSLSEKELAENNMIDYNVDELAENHQHGKLKEQVKPKEIKNTVESKKNYILSNDLIEKITKNILGKLAIKK